VQKQQMGSYTYEHLIIDGASTDSTLSVVNRLKNDHTLVVSEPDKGLYDAMNKGIQMAHGRIIAILNADDFYIDEHVLKKVITRLDATGVDCVYGQVIVVDGYDPRKPLFQSCITHDHKQLFRWGKLPSHPAFFVRKTAYDKYGIYNSDFNIAADLDLLHRFLLLHRLPFAVIPEPLTVMRLGGLSTINRIRGCLQCCQSRYKLGLKYTLMDWLLIAGTMGITFGFRALGSPDSELAFRKWLRPHMKSLHDTHFFRSIDLSYFR
jgi:glycosyltransferase involved in cell wall biosynthesis